MRYYTYKKTDPHVIASILYSLHGLDTLRNRKPSPTAGFAISSSKSLPHKTRKSDQFKTLSQCIRFVSPEGTMFSLYTRANSMSTIINNIFARHLQYDTA